VSKRFTLDRRSFEQLLAAVSLFQSPRQANAKRINEGNPPLLPYLLETLRASDSGALVLQAALERVTSSALPIVGGDCAVLWLFTSEKMICRAAVGANVEDGEICTALRSKLQSGGAFGENPPSKLDLMRTLEKYSGSLGSSLAIAILPGGRIAGALAVFSNQSTAFTARDYANLRQLAGLAQYVLARRVAERKPHDSLDDSLEGNPDTRVFFKIHATSLMERSATAPLMYPAPTPEYVRHGKMENVYVPTVGTPVVLGRSANKRPQTGTEVRSLSASAALAIRKRMQSLRAVALDAARNSVRRVRDVRVNWIALKQAAPPIAILTVMCFFVALLTSGGRQSLVGSSLSATAEATTTPVKSNSGNSVNQKAVAMPNPRKSAAVPVETSHLQVTDRQTAETITDLSKHELRSLRRAADYDDDQAALELGMLYELGRGFPQSCNQAAKWVTRAAENGNAAAEYNLGLRYRDGDGVDTNLQQAERWLRRAVAHKNSNAERALGALPSYYPEPSVGKMAKTTPLAVPTP
jgi:Sel1 repeat-containing protein